MKSRADLHLHSTFSDGTLTPTQLVRAAKKKGLKTIVLTDHDSVGGCAEGRAAATKEGLRFGFGIEINTREADMVHILGYGIDPESPALTERLSEFRRRRRERIRRIVGRLRDEHQIDIDFDEVRVKSTETLGRPHVADVLIRKKAVRSRSEAFQKYLQRGAAAYIDPLGPTAEEAIEAIKGAGGWASLAHPLTTAYKERLEAWTRAGLEGFEVYYGSHTGPQTARLLATAEKFDLIPTGGSDYHGPGSGRESIGGIAIPDDVFARFEDRLKLS
ncbi:MAG: PHP domain-containing protein [Elusimicrobiota bacterium]